MEKRNAVVDDVIATAFNALGGARAVGTKLFVLNKGSTTLM